MKETKKGFTLIELVVVMAIIAILSVIIVGAILAARSAATNTQRTGTIRTLETALEARSSRCNGLYFTEVSSISVCTPAIDTTSLDSIVTSLKNDKFLTLDVTFDDTTKFVKTIPRLDGTCTYVVNGTNPATETCVPGVNQGANSYRMTALDNNFQPIYSAQR